MAEDFTSLVGDLVEVRKQIKELRLRESLLVGEIHAVAPARKSETCYGIVQVAKRYNRKWDHDEVIRHLTRVALDQREFDAETGELLDRPTWERVAAAITACAGISYWRRGDLDKFGLDSDEFTEVTSTPLQVTIS